MSYALYLFNGTFIYIYYVVYLFIRISNLLLLSLLNLNSIC